MKSAAHQILIGLHRVGLEGLHEAFETADAAGGVDRETLLDLMMEIVERRNFVPPAAAEDYRRALWREYLRHRGEDFSAYFSEIEVVVRGEPGDARDDFVRSLESVFAEHELRPVVTFEPPAAEGPSPQLVIAGETVTRGAASRPRLRQAVRRQISDW